MSQSSQVLSVNVDLAGGPLCGQIVEAPRDDCGRVLAAIRVRQAPDGVNLIVVPAQPSNPRLGSTYRFESWMGQYPVYRHTP